MGVKITGKVLPAGNVKISGGSGSGPSPDAWFNWTGIVVAETMPLPTSVENFVA